MRQRRLRIGVVAATVVAAVVPLIFAVQPAAADYAPSGNDVVGVGSDTLQYMLDFLADGDAYGDVGYNHLGNKYKLVSIDATADANARLAYGPDGGEAGQADICTPGTGSVAGTDNATGNPDNTDPGGTPCVLNPTVVLRAGLQPVQRPNGSGAGFSALLQDIIAGHNSGTNSTGGAAPVADGGKPEVINFARASSAETTSVSMPTVEVGGTSVTEQVDQLEVATDTLPMLAATTTHAVPLSASQLSIIYAQTTCSITWNNPGISGTFLEGASLSTSSDVVTIPSSDPQPTSSEVGDTVEAESAALANNGDIPASTTITAVGTDSITLSADPTTGGTSDVGIVNPSASSAPILPLIPQIGSGTRKVFLGDLVPTLSNAGACPLVAEENDPTAIYDVTSGDSVDAIEPISQGRLDLFNGVTSTGNNEGFGYFDDPSCAYLAASSACGSGTVGSGSDTYVPYAVNAPVTPITTGTPTGLGAYTGTGAGGGLFNPTRPLYLYFRNTDITSPTAWQPGTSENWLNTLFYDPCEAGQTCVTFNGGTYGPDGPPYIETSEGQTLLEDAGVIPLDVEVCEEITNGDTSC